MNSLFDDVDNVIYVDVSQETTKLTEDITYTFIKYSNLQKINISNIDASNLNEKDNLYVDCQELTENEGLEYLNTSQVKNSTGMYLRCDHIKFIKLYSSNFMDDSESDVSYYNVTNPQDVEIPGFAEIQGMLGYSEDFNPPVLLRIGPKSNKTVLVCRLYLIYSFF